MIDLVDATSSTRWPACATTRCPPARSARATRRSWPRTAASSPRIQGPAARARARSARSPRGPSPRSANDPAKKFVEYMMSDGYEPWLGIAPEGKIPVRTGDARRPDRSTPTRWAALQVGRRHQGAAGRASTRQRRHRPAARRHRATCDRWAIPQGQGDLLGAIEGRAAVAKAIVDEVGERPHDAAPTRPSRPPTRSRRPLQKYAPVDRRPPSARRRAPEAPVSAPNRRRRSPPGPARTGTGYLLISPTVVDRLRDGRAADPVERRRWPSRTSGCSTCEHGRHRATTAWTTSQKVFTAPGSGLAVAPRWSTRSRRPSGDRPGAGRRAGAAQAVPRPRAGAGLHADPVRRPGGRGHVRVEDDAQPAVRHRQPLRHHAARLGRADRLPELGSPVAVRRRPARALAC